MVDGLVESCSESKRGKGGRKVVNLLIEVAPRGKGEGFEGGGRASTLWLNFCPNAMHAREGGRGGRG